MMQAFLLIFMSILIIGDGIITWLSYRATEREFEYIRQRINELERCAKGRKTKDTK